MFHVCVREIEGDPGDHCPCPRAVQSRFTCSSCFRFNTISRGEGRKRTGKGVDDVGNCEEFPPKKKGSRRGGGGGFTVEDLFLFGSMNLLAIGC